MISGLLEHARTVLTLHNSYDAAIGKRHKLMFFGKQIPGDTVLQCSLPMLSGPLTTVSTVFAHELCHDPLQRGVFVNHLQNLFSKNPPIGIENGVFGSGRGPFEQSLLKKGKKQIFADLASKKEMHRGLLREELSRMMAHPGSIGNLELSENDRRTPVFVMLGRLDLMQKGYDVVFHAFKRLPKGKARLIFCPSSGSNPENLSFFKAAAEERKGEIVIFPFRITNEQYALFLRGSSFFIMPSFYEPFGSVTEAFLNGTPVLARATGGSGVRLIRLMILKFPWNIVVFCILTIHLILLRGSFSERRTWGRLRRGTGGIWLVFLLRREYQTRYSHRWWILSTVPLVWQLMLFPVLNSISA